VPTWLIILVVILLLLAAGGIVARTRQLRRSQPAFEASLEQVNRDLAAAAAQDRGWDRATLEEAARRCYEAERGSAPQDLVLIEVIDRPGTDADKAVFRVGGRELLTLGRREGEWVHDSLQS
jgi:Sec-independent protein translocase protein TatA